MTRLQKAYTVLLVAALIGAVGLLMNGVPRRPAPAFRDLPDILRDDLARGWSVVQEPAVPGPYRVAASTVQPKGAPGRSFGYSTSGRTVQHTFTRRDGIEQMAVALEAEGGGLTVVVLGK
jgi:hypothetical protein